MAQTLSKSRSLARLRVGFAMGRPAPIAELEQFNGSFNSYPLEWLSQAGAEAARREENCFELTCQVVMRSRQTLADDLTALGSDVLLSAANFLLVRHPSLDAVWLQAQLLERRILVRATSRARASSSTCASASERSNSAGSWWRRCGRC